MFSIKDTKIQINSLALRLLGILAMAAGGFGVIKGYSLIRLQSLTWFSFTIFAFLLTEGNINTSDKVLYLRRFAIFTIITEITYDLMMTGKLYSPRSQSCMITLLIGLIIFTITDFLKKKYNNIVLDGLVLTILTSASCFAAARLKLQFGIYGVLIMVLFYLSKNVTYRKIMEASVLIYIAFYLASGAILVVKIGGIQYPLSAQVLSIAALPFIWMYNGVRGPNTLKLKISYYTAMPLICLVLYGIKYYIFK